MSDDTTTSEDKVEGADNAQLEDESQNTEAVEQDEDTSQTSESDESESEESGNSEEDEIKDWAAKKNLPLDDPLKIAKMYREAEQALGKKGQKEGQLKAAVTNANTESGTEDYQALRNEMTALTFKVEHPEAVELESEMVSILEEKPWLASDLDSVLDIAKGRAFSNPAELLAARKAGSKEALAQAAKASRGAAPKASASNSKSGATNQITLDNVDRLIAEKGQDWYLKNRDKINEVLANG
jgi:hypothetical protein